MRRVLATCFLATIGGIAAACGSKDGDGAERKTATATTPTAATATPPAATATATAEAAPAKPPPVPVGRSKAPTLDEWASQKKEVTVKGSSALKCETKIVREYLRISCKGKVDPEGEPSSIKILKGGGEALAFATTGVTSLILPYVEGTDFEGVFSWTKKSHKLGVKWPKGSKQPEIVGAFEGAASPLDGTAKGNDENLCACHKKVTGSASCDELYGAADADCDRSYAGDCGKLLACARGEWEAWPRCLPGFGNIPPIGRCGKLCGGRYRACAAGGTCYYLYADADVGVCAN